MELLPPEEPPSRFDQDRWARKFLAQLSAKNGLTWMEAHKQLAKARRFAAMYGAPAPKGFLSVEGHLAGVVTEVKHSFDPPRTLLEADFEKIELHGTLTFRFYSQGLRQQYVSLQEKGLFPPSRPEPIANAFGALYDGRPVEIDPDAEIY